jgi:hypothetical protein
MKTFRNALIVCTLLGAAGAATAQINLPTPNVPGASPETAVRIIGTSEIMIDRYIRRWLRTHYPNWDAEPHEMTEIGMRRYAVVYISPPPNSNASRQRVYFRLASSRVDDEDGEFPFPE